jgi:hypothetical protein
VSVPVKWMQNDDKESACTRMPESSWLLRVGRRHFLSLCRIIYLGYVSTYLQLCTESTWKKGLTNCEKRLVPMTHKSQAANSNKNLPLFCFASRDTPALLRCNSLSLSLLFTTLCLENAVVSVSFAHGGTAVSVS